MTVAELIDALSVMPQTLTVVVTWEGTINAVEDMMVDPDIRIAHRDRVTVGAVVIDGEIRLDLARTQ